MCPESPHHVQSNSVVRVVLARRRDRVVPLQLPQRGRLFAARVRRRRHLVGPQSGRARHHVLNVRHLRGRRLRHRQMAIARVVRVMGSARNNGRRAVRTQSMIPGASGVVCVGLRRCHRRQRVVAVRDGELVCVDRVILVRRCDVVDRHCRNLRVRALDDRLRKARAEHDESEREKDIDPSHRHTPFAHSVSEFT